MKEFLKELLVCAGIVIGFMSIFFAWTFGIGTLLCGFMPEMLAYTLALTSFFVVLIIITSIITKKPIIEVLNDISES